MPRASSPPPKARARRSPEEARALILSAAKRLFAAKGPDAVGLKEVASAAGVSHALVSHYFGTYEALVEEAFASHLRAARERFFLRMAETQDDDAAGWLEQLFATSSDPLYARLVAWAALGGKHRQDDFFPRREQGVRAVVDVLVARLESRGVSVDREDLEVSLLLVVTSAIGYAVLGKALWGALGHDATAERDARYRAKVAALAERELSRVKAKRREGGKRAISRRPPR